MNRHLFGGFLITLAMVLFSLIGPFIRFTDLPPLAIIFYSTLFTSTILFVYLLSTGKAAELLIGKRFFWLLISSLCLLGNTYTYFTAYKITTLANAVLTHYTAPIFTALFAPVFLKEHLEKTTVTSLATASVGLFLIASNDLALSRHHLTGILYGSFSGFFYGMLILVSKKLVCFFSPFVILFYQCTVTAILLFPLMVTPQYAISHQQAGLLLIYALLISILAVTLYLKGLRHVQAQHAGILAYSEPVIVVLIGIFFFKEALTLRLFTGGLLILFSGYLILRAEAKRKDA